MTGRAGIYVRVSVDREADDDRKRSASPEQQLKECRAAAKREGLQVVEVYEDRDRSASKKSVQRPAWDRMLADVDAGRIDAIVCWAVDRMTRLGISQFELFERVPVLSATEGWQKVVGADELNLTIRLWNAKEESRKISERVSRARRAEAEAGKMSTGGPRPYGYTVKGVVVPEEAEVIREVAKRALSGESFRRIAMDLNERGVQTSRGGTWQSSVLAGMIRSPLRAGFVVHQGEVIGRAEERQIISPHDHQLLLATRIEPRAHRSQTHLLAGIIFCAECKGRMKSMGWMMKNGRTFPRYACVKSPGLPNCGGVNVTEKSTNEFVKRKVFGVLSGGNLHPAHREPELDRAALDRIVADAERKMSELTHARFTLELIPTNDAYLTALGPLHEMRDSARKLIAQLDDEQRRVEATHGLKPGSLEELEGWWSTATDVEKRDAVQQVVKRVEVTKAKRRGGNVFDSTRVTIGFDWSLLEKIADKVGAEMTDAEREAAEAHDFAAKGAELDGEPTWGVVVDVDQG